MLEEVSTTSAPKRRTRALSPEFIDAVSRYDAPFLIGKLRKNHVFASDDEARALFRELKRYFLINFSDPDRAYSIVSNRVDEVWHQFILFSAEYAEFCRRFFGGMLEHLPSNAPVTGTPRPVVSLDEFADRYRALFGEGLPDVWRDDLAVTATTRVVVDRELYPDLEARTAPNDAAKTELVAEGQVLVRVDAWAAPAIDFALRAGAFFVRELPPPLRRADKVALCRTLVRLKVLRVTR